MCIRDRNKRVSIGVSDIEGDAVNLDTRRLIGRRGHLIQQGACGTDLHASRPSAGHFDQGFARFQRRFLTDPAEDRLRFQRCDRNRPRLRAAIKTGCNCHGRGRGGQPEDRQGDHNLVERETSLASRGFTG